MNKKILWKLIASFATVLLLFSVVLGTVFLLLFRQHTIEINRTDLEKKAVSIADTISSFQSLDETGNMGMGGGGYRAYLRFINELAMADVWIIDQNYSFITSGHRAGIKPEMPPMEAMDMVPEILEGKGNKREFSTGIFKTPTLIVGEPIILPNGHVTGAVLVRAPIKGINAAIGQGLSALAAGILAALFFAAAAALLLSYRLTAPLHKIRKAALALAAGDYDAKSGVIQKDEIGQLASVIDFLAHRLSEAEKERKALDKLKEDFVANVSHELRTPVAVLRGSVEVLRDGTVSNPDEVLEYYDQMLSESCHLERLVNDLLDLSRLQDNSFVLTMAEVNLCDIIRDAVRSGRRFAIQKSVDIESVLPGEDCTVWGDYGRIRQMLLILIDNAIKFSNEGTTISIQLNIQDSQYLLSVTDYGETIPVQLFPHIFDRFKKINMEKNKGGTGLGLAIAKQIADRHHVRIQAESSQGRTCFSLYFNISE